MPKLPSPTSVVVTTALAWLAFAPSANAYIDAGSTAIIFQSIVAALAAGGMFFKVFKDRLAGLFRFGRKDDDTASATTGEADGEAATASDPSPSADAALATSATTAGEGTSGEPVDDR